MSNPAGHATVTVGSFVVFAATVAHLFWALCSGIFVEFVDLMGCVYAYGWLVFMSGVATVSLCGFVQGIRRWHDKSTSRS